MTDIPDDVLREFDRVFEQTEDDAIGHDDWYYQQQDQNDLRYGG